MFVSTAGTGGVGTGAPRNKTPKAAGGGLNRPFTEQ
jgi:hypothetical protein